MESVNLWHLFSLFAGIILTLVTSMTIAVTLIGSFVSRYYKGKEELTKQFDMQLKELREKIDSINIEQKTQKESIGLSTRFIQEQKDMLNQLSQNTFIKGKEQ